MTGFLPHLRARESAVVCVSSEPTLAASDAAYAGCSPDTVMVGGDLGMFPRAVKFYLWCRYLQNDAKADNLAKSELKECVCRNPEEYRAAPKPIVKIFWIF